MANHAPAESPTVPITVMVGNEAKFLGSLAMERELEEDSIVKEEAAEEKIEELVEEGYLAVFPLSKSSSISAVVDHGLDPKRSLISGTEDLRGSIGKLPVHKDEYYWVLLINKEDHKKVDPRFTRKGDKAFIGTVGLSAPISKDNIIIVDPLTLIIHHAPANFNLQAGEMLKAPDIEAIRHSTTGRIDNIA